MRYIDSNSIVIDAYPIEDIGDLTATDGLIILQLPADAKDFHLMPFRGSDYQPKIGDFAVRHIDGHAELIPRKLFEQMYRVAE